ncbi:MAG: HNH endonuclease signature motif containing protein, partial [Nocardioides sp.]
HDESDPRCGDTFYPRTDDPPDLGPLPVDPWAADYEERWNGEGSQERMEALACDLVDEEAEEMWFYLQFLAESAPAPATSGLISRTSLPSDGYRPTALLEVVARFLWGTCTVPGCEKAAWSCDLDHVDEYDHFQPSHGGPTCLCNLAPKCRFHHLIKTNLVGYVDDLVLDDQGRYRTVVTIGDGMTAEAVAPNQWLFPELDRLRCQHQVTAGSAACGRTVVGVVGVVGSNESGQVGPYRKLTRTEVKHAWRRAERARNRRDRAAEAQPAEAIVVEPAFDDGGPPPF